MSENPNQDGFGDEGKSRLSKRSKSPSTDEERASPQKKHKRSGSLSDQPSISDTGSSREPSETQAQSPTRAQSSETQAQSPTRAQSSETQAQSPTRAQSSETQSQSPTRAQSLGTQTLIKSSETFRTSAKIKFSPRPGTSRTSSPQEESTPLGQFTVSVKSTSSNLTISLNSKSPEVGFRVDATSSDVNVVDASSPVRNTSEKSTYCKFTISEGSAGERNTTDQSEQTLPMASSTSGVINEESLAERNRTDQSVQTSPIVPSTNDLTEESAAERNRTEKSVQTSPIVPSTSDDKESAAEINRTDQLEQTPQTVQPPAACRSPVVASPAGTSDKSLERTYFRQIRFQMPACPPHVLRRRIIKTMVKFSPQENIASRTSQVPLETPPVATFGNVSQEESTSQPQKASSSPTSRSPIVAPPSGTNDQSQETYFQQILLRLTSRRRSVDDSRILAREIVQYGDLFNILHEIRQIVRETQPMASYAPQEAPTLQLQESSSSPTSRSPVAASPSGTNDHSPQQTLFHQIMFRLASRRHSVDDSRLLARAIVRYGNLLNIISEISKIVQKTPPVVHYVPQEESTFQSQESSSSPTSRSPEAASPSGTNDLSPPKTYFEQIMFQLRSQRHSLPDSGLLARANVPYGNLLDIISEISRMVRETPPVATTSQSQTESPYFRQIMFELTTHPANLMMVNVDERKRLLARAMVKFGHPSSIPSYQIRQIARSPLRASPSGSARCRLSTPLFGSPPGPSRSQTTPPGPSRTLGPYAIKNEPTDQPARTPPSGEDGSQDRFSSRDTQSTSGTDDQRTQSPRAVSKRGRTLSTSPGVEKTPSKRNRSVQLEETPSRVVSPLRTSPSPPQCSLFPLRGLFGPPASRRDQSSPGQQAPPRDQSTGQPATPMDQSPQGQLTPPSDQSPPGQLTPPSDQSP